MVRFLVIGKPDRTNIIQNSVDPQNREEVAVFAALQFLRMPMIIIELRLVDVISHAVVGIVIPLKKRLMPL
jgi:hypothetical protein